MVLRESTGNMYEWVTHTHNLIGGECLHKCAYCYVESTRWGRPLTYVGKLRALENEFRVAYGKGKTIFVGSANDIWAEGVPSELILRVLAHCGEYPDNTYLFQSKNPRRFLSFLNHFPPHTILATTIETDIHYPDISQAPPPRERAHYMGLIRDHLKTAPNHQFKLAVTIEPIMKCDPVELVRFVTLCEPDWVSIGADSQHCHLPEPPLCDVERVIAELNERGYKVVIKPNLARLAERAVMRDDWWRDVKQGVGEDADD